MQLLRAPASRSHLAHSHLPVFTGQNTEVQKMLQRVWHAKIRTTKNSEMSICYQHCGSANWRHTTVGISWHLGKRQAADRQIISTGAATQLELPTAAMLLGERGLQGLLREAFTHSVKIKAQTAFLSSLYSTHFAHTTTVRKKNGEAEHTAIEPLVMWRAGMQRWWLTAHGHMPPVWGRSPARLCVFVNYPPAI